MNKKMLFVFNPKAGKGKIKTNLLDIVDIFNKGGYEVIIYSTQKPKDAYEKAKEYESKVDLIVCSTLRHRFYPTAQSRRYHVAFAANGKCRYRPMHGVSHHCRL